MRTKAVFLASCALALAACSTQGATYTLAFNIKDPAKISQLKLATMHVVERMLESQDEEATDLDVETNGTGALLHVATRNTATDEFLRAALTSPFKLRIMREAKQGETADITVEGHGPFKETGITQADIEWMQATEEPEGKGRVTITFTQAGRDKMATVFKENKGKNIGLFVRDLLVSKLAVETDTLLDDIVITGIPSIELARTFADDVNVGLHVTITPAL